MYSLYLNTSYIFLCKKGYFCVLYWTVDTFWVGIYPVVSTVT